MFEKIPDATLVELESGARNLRALLKEMRTRMEDLIESCSAVIGSQWALSKAKTYRHELEIAGLALEAVNQEVNTIELSLREMKSLSRTDPAVGQTEMDV